MLEMCQNELQRSRDSRKTDDRRCGLSFITFQFTPHANKRVKYNKVFSGLHCREQVNMAISYLDFEEGVGGGCGLGSCCLEYKD